MSERDALEPRTPAAAGAARPVARSAAAALRVLAWLLGGAAALGTAILIAGELAAARVPEHRAALADLIRRQTGLDLTFSELSVRWGWYGPEAVFHDVALPERGRRSSLLRCPRLIVGLDVWRLLRSGELEAARITLANPDIDLSALPPAEAPDPRAAPAALPAAAQLLTRWRGGRIDLQGGTVRWTEPAGALTVNVRYAQLRREGSRWQADALVLLPASLGASAHLSLALRADPAGSGPLRGTVDFEGRLLEFAGWHALADYPAALRYLPRGGRGNLVVHSAIAGGRVSRVDGTLAAEALEWSPPVDGAAALAVDRLHGKWQLQRSGALWRLTAATEPGAPAAAPIAVSAELGAAGASARGSVRSAPVTLLAALLHAYAPQLPLSQLSLGGVVRTLEFDWDAARPAGTRLVTRTQLAELSVATAAHDVALTGLHGELSGMDTQLVADLTADAARLTVNRPAAVELADLALATRVTLSAQAGAWRLASDGCRIRLADMSLAASFNLGAADARAAPELAARLAVKDADAALLAALLGSDAPAAPGEARLSAGRIVNADLEWRGPLPAAPFAWHPGTVFRGNAELRDATVAASQLWPEAHALSARLDWQGPRFRAAISAGQLGEWQLAAARASWDARGAHATHVSARLGGDLGPALSWLRAHPPLAAAVAGLAQVDLRGAALLDVDVLVPAVTRGTARAGAVPGPRVRLAAMLDRAELRPLAGLPPLEALRGTLAVAGGHLQPATLSGRWLGGPVTVGVAERHEAALSSIALSGHGVIEARQALRAAGASADAPLSGNAEWSALLTLQPSAAGAGGRWRLRADSTLLGVGSALPEPFAKAAATALPLHLDVQAADDVGQLRVALGERLRGAAAFTRSGELWRIDRGVVRLAATAPALPAEPVLLLDGRAGRLDLPAYLSLWRQVGRDAALPPLRARLTAAQLTAGPWSFADVAVAADADAGGGQLELASSGVSGSARWSARGNEPVMVRLSRLNVTGIEDAMLGAALAGALGPPVRLSIDDLEWQGRGLGSLGATLTAGADAFDISDAHLSHAAEETRAAVHCQAGTCRLSFGLDSHDAAATLATFGLRPELEAAHAELGGELAWPQRSAPSLASLNGHLHMRLEQGSTRLASIAPELAPFALLAVPALARGMSAPPGEAPTPALGFSSLTAHFAVQDGEATTVDLHFDGDAEILVRGRVGLLARDYDEQAWILRGEERLPDALRRLGPTPRVAAVWLSLRELIGSVPAERSRQALHLRGSWDEPIVTSE